MLQRWQNSVSVMTRSGAAFVQIISLISRGNLGKRVSSVAIAVMYQDVMYNCR